jgi:hypothetical protein
VKTFGRFSSRRCFEHRKNFSGRIRRQRRDQQHPARIEYDVSGSRRMGCISDF